VSGQQPRFEANALIDFAAALFAGVGAESDKASTVAELLVEADLMGHTTHGLQLCAPYLKSLDSGTMRGEGTPEVVADSPAAVVWDGNYLPGVWLAASAVDLGVARARETGLAAVSIRRSHHIGCLAVFLERATRVGCAAMVTCSDPSVASVAPYGGLDPVFTPDPLALGIPTGEDPILIDISASISTNGLAARLHASGERFPHPWAMDNAGVATNDPGVLLTDPPGTLLPAGGLDHGHKGYALALMVESLSQGLGGYGRADSPDTWGASVYVQVWDPEKFTGAAAFNRQTAWLAETARGSRPAHAGKSVRLPGQRALALKREALADGVPLHEGIMESLLPWAERFGVEAPSGR